jgi:hypothetical protein
VAAAATEPETDSEQAPVEGELTAGGGGGTEPPRGHYKGRGRPW